ncbi:tyrosinase-like [Rana temporaria]|uniref:tyrosinase-like n=1 Tax=Rana temporaria TaxID=8407 RepID=UPI001AAD3BCA|nr:tyrosinase-like [Rana temporaria]
MTRLSPPSQASYKLTSPSPDLPKETTNRILPAADPEVMVILLVLLAFCLSAVDGQFPRVCSTEAAFHTKTCCPLWRDKSPCGSLSGRGRCRNWSTLYGNKIPLNNDDRLDWPRYYYENTCECHGNYSGFDCGDCKFGHHGEKCDRKKVVVRRELRELTFLEQKRLFSYLALAKTTKCRDFVILSTGDRFHQETYRFVDASLYNVFAWMHYYSMKPILINGTFNPHKNFAHQGPIFPGWHRLNLLFLERQIQLMTGDEDFAIPYYDWRGEKNCSICTDELLGTNDAQGVLSPYSHFSFWKAICSGFDFPDEYCPLADEEYKLERLHRKPGTTPYAPNLPTYEDVDNALKLEEMDTPPFNETSRRSFRNSLEGFLSPDGVTLKRSLHNLVHIYLGGTMSQIPISSNDPIFILHHSFIDKIFETWITKYNKSPDDFPENNLMGQGPNDCATPYFPCYKNKDFIHSSTKFGYQYSSFLRKPPMGRRNYQ